MKTTPSPQQAAALAGLILALAAPTVFAQIAADDHAAHHPPTGDTPAATAETPSPAPPPEPAAPGGMGMKHRMKQGAGKHAGKGPTAQSSGPRPPGTALHEAAAQPGIAGTSHLHPIGARDFFLDHDALIALTPEQRKALRQLRERSLLDEAESARKIDSAEQALWVLTSADAPDLGRIESQLKTVEALRTARRLAFIKAVADAAALLTEHQRQILLGNHPVAK